LNDFVFSVCLFPSQEKFRTQTTKEASTNPDFSGETFSFQLQGDSLNHAAPDPAILRLACFVMVDGQDVLLGNCFCELFEIEDRLLTGQKVPVEMTFLKPSDESKVARLQISLQMQMVDVKNGKTTAVDPSDLAAGVSSIAPSASGGALGMSLQHDGFMGQTGGGSGGGAIGGMDLPRDWLNFMLRTVSSIDAGLASSGGLTLAVAATCGTRSSEPNFEATTLVAHTLPVPVVSSVVVVNQTLLVGVPANLPKDGDTVLHIRLTLLGASPQITTSTDIIIELDGMQSHFEYTADVQFSPMTLADAPAFSPRLFLSLSSRASILHPNSSHLADYARRHAGRLEFVMQDLVSAQVGELSVLGFLTELALTVDISY
jgi:hypothetical protein